jgi:cyclopropane fatty-acyl-phospholipid synthase-like methyltransferase
VQFLINDAPEVVLDVGCGRAELLLRTVGASPGCHGIGIDQDAAAIHHGNALAVSRGLGERVVLIAGGASVDAPQTADCRAARRVHLATRVG